MNQLQVVNVLKFLFKIALATKSNNGFLVASCAPKPMGKILAFDYGLKRTGIAITDDLKMIGSPLETVETKDLMPWLEKLLLKEKIELFVVGEARRLNGDASETTFQQLKFTELLHKKFPQIAIARVDETYTSKIAAAAMVQGGMKKSDRRKKENLDKVSAAIILQSYLDGL
jgi:putative holliday junction resolvase